MVESRSWQWDRVSDTMWQEPAEEVYYLADRWKAAGRGRVLDLCCGVGRHSIMLAQRGFSVDAFDLSPAGIAAVDKAARALNLSIATRLGDMLSLPYESGCFDAVLAFHSIYHTDRAGLERVIGNIDRVLAPGGEAYVTFNSLANPIFRDPANKHIGENTIVKTEGIEAGIPHYGVDEAEVWRLMRAFEMIRLIHVEEIGNGWRAWHYHALAAKPGARK